MSTRKSHCDFEEVRKAQVLSARMALFSVLTAVHCLHCTAKWKDAVVLLCGNVLLKALEIKL